MVEIPMVSILIPVYNREQFIEACVESALDQSYRDFEIVISDNASTDRTWDLCQKLAQSDSRIRIFRNETNLGPVRNWQRAAHEARGRLGKFLFSDDLMMRKYLAWTVPFLDDPQVGIVTTAANVSGKVEYLWNRSGKTPRLPYLWAMMHNGRLPVSPGAALMRMADLRKNLVDFHHHGIGPDLLLLMFTAAAYPSAAHVPEPLVFFRDHPGSISTERQSELAWGYAMARARFLLSRVRLMHT